MSSPEKWMEVINEELIGMLKDYSFDDKVVIRYDVKKEAIYYGLNMSHADDKTNMAGAIMSEVNGTIPFGYTFNFGGSIPINEYGFTFLACEVIDGVVQCEGEEEDFNLILKEMFKDEENFDINDKMLIEVMKVGMEEEEKELLAKFVHDFYRYMVKEHIDSKKLDINTWYNRNGLNEVEMYFVTYVGDIDSYASAVKFLTAISNSLDKDAEEIIEKKKYMSLNRALFKEPIKDLFIETVTVNGRINKQTDFLELPALLESVNIHTYKEAYATIAFRITEFIEYKD